MTYAKLKERQIGLPFYMFWAVDNLWSCAMLSRDLRQAAGD